VGVLAGFRLPLAAATEGDEAAEPALQWFGPRLSLTFGPYFERTPNDDKATSERVREDLDAALITKRTAVEALAAIYKIDDVEAYLEQLETENTEREAKTATATHAALQGLVSRAEQETGGTATVAAGAEPRAGVTAQQRGKPPGVVRSVG
jgi:hypothetical protein